MLQYHDNVSISSGVVSRTHWFRIFRSALAAASGLNNGDKTCTCRTCGKTRIDRIQVDRIRVDRIRVERIRVAKVATVMQCAAIDT
jgi:hypothetical protein